MKKNEICFWSRFVVEMATDEPNANDIAAETMAVASGAKYESTCVQRRRFHRLGQWLVQLHKKLHRLVRNLERE